MIDALLAARTAEALAACCVADVHYEDAFLDAPLRGLAPLAEHRARLDAAFPDLEAVLAAPPVREGAALVCAVRARGWQSGVTDDLPGLDRAIDVHAVLWVETAADGRAARLRLFVDRWTVAEQLGVLPRPGSAGARALRVLQGFGLR